MLPTLALLILGGAVALELALPRTLFGFRCYGANPTCNIDACVDLGVDDPQLGIQNFVSWMECSKASRNRVRGAACVYDQDLYMQSRGALGYDFCTGSAAAALGSDFPDGVNVFEDAFEHWHNESWSYANHRLPGGSGDRSALWDAVVNARPDDGCGSAWGPKLYLGTVEAQGQS